MGNYSRKPNFILQEDKFVWLPSTIHSNPCATKFVIPKGSIELCDENGKNCFAGPAITLQSYCIDEKFNRYEQNTAKSLENGEIFTHGSSLTNYSYAREIGNLHYSDYGSFIESDPNKDYFSPTPWNNPPSRYDQVSKLLKEIKNRI